MIRVVCAYWHEGSSRVGMFVVEITKAGGYIYMQTNWPGFTRGVPIPYAVSFACSDRRNFVCPRKRSAWEERYLISQYGAMLYIFWELFMKYTIRMAGNGGI